MLHNNEKCHEVDRRYDDDYYCYSSSLWWHANKVSSLCCVNMFIYVCMCVCVPISLRKKREEAIIITITINKKKNTFSVQSKQK